MEAAIFQTAFNLKNKILKTNLMKQILTLTLLMSCIVGLAQDVSTKIPKDALAVATIKGSNLTQLMSVDEMNTSYAGKQLLKQLSKLQDQPLTSLNDLGFNLEANWHYFYQANDSINYNVMLLPLRDVSKFERLMTAKKNIKIISKNGFKTMEKDSLKNDVVFWDNSAVVFVMGSLKDYYFEEKEIMNRYGLQELPDYDYGNYDDTEVYDVPEDDVIPEAEESMEDAVDESDETVIESAETYDYIEDATLETPNDNDEEIVDEVYEDDYSYENDPYNSVYNTNYDIKKVLKEEWSTAQAIKILSQTADQSIINNQSYTASLDTNAEATFWVGDFQKIYENLVGGMFYNALAGFNLGAIYADSGMNAKLFAENDKMKLTTSITMSESMADSYEKMTDKKLNKKFLNYINEDRMVGYLAYAMNTEATLKEYPKLLKNLYANMPMYGEEASLAVDLFELLLDEEAVAKVLPGDMLFVLSGITQKERTYKTYNYNDDYEYEEVENTKMETVPDFLFMVSSEDQRLLKKLVDYGIKKKVMEAKNGYYALKIPESPLEMFMSFKDDIVFMGTSEVEMKQIMIGTFVSKVSSKHKKLIKDSNYTMYVSGKQLASKIPMDDLKAADLKKLNWFLNNSEDAYIKSSRMKGNTWQAEMVVGVPATEENSLKYIFNMIEEFSK